MSDEFVCDNPKHAKCNDCSGEIIVGKFDTITVPRLDEDGFPALDAEGRVPTVQLRLPQHVLMITHSRYVPSAAS